MIKWISVCLIFSFISCQDKPKILTEEQMIDFFIEMHISDAMSLSAPSELVDSLNTVYYAQILQDLDVSDEEIQASLEYYYNQPLVIEQIFTKIEVELDEMRDDLRDQQEENRSVQKKQFESKD